MPEKMHDCCSNCHKICKCGAIEVQCDKEIPTYEKTLEPVPILPVRIASAEDRYLFREVMTELKCNVDKEIQDHESFTDKRYMSGISEAIIEDLVEKVEFVNSFEFLFQNTAVFLERIAREIILILHEIFGDIPLEDLDRAENTVSQKESLSSEGHIKFSSDVESESSDSELPGIESRIKK